MNNNLKEPTDLYKKRRSFLKWLMILFLTWGSYFIYIWNNMLYWKKDGIYAGWRYVWGDWPGQFAFAMRFAYWSPFRWFESNPLYVEHKFTYHFFANMIPGILIRLGFDEVKAFVIPSILTTLVLLISLYVFYFNELNSPAKSYFALTIFLANGGLGFLWLISDFIKSQKIETIVNPVHQYTNFPKLHIHCNNFITTEFLPQRPFLLGVTVALLLFIILMNWIKKDFKNINSIKLFIMGLFIGFMPIIHSYTFIALIVFIFVCFITIRNHFTKWTTISLGVLFSGFLVNHFIFGDQIPRSMIKLYFGWLATEQKVNFLYFWLINWGLFLPLLIVSIKRFQYYKNPLIVSGIMIFILCNVFSFSPFKWDSYKLLTWSYLFFCIPVVEYLGKLWDSNRRTLKVFVIIAVFSMIASGLIDLHRITNFKRFSLRMWTMGQVNLAKEFRKISSPYSRVLTAGSHDHWVACLSGRQILMGYRHWLGTWGINTDEIAADIRRMFVDGSSAEELFEKYKVDYVVIGQQELSSYRKLNTKYFEENYQKVLEKESTKIFSIKKDKIQ